MNINDPFETFKYTAFRLEGLPEYLVEEEAIDFQKFKDTGELSNNEDSSWKQLVKNSIDHGKSIQRLRLTSDELTQYEQFELQSYPGIEVGEEIRINSKFDYKDKYIGDFWFFDDKYITEISYKEDGTFVSLNTKIATKKEVDLCHYWIDVFKQSRLLSD